MRHSESSPIEGAILVCPMSAAPRCSSTSHVSTPEDSISSRMSGFDPLVRKIVEWIESRRLTTPALMFLEMHRPLRGLAHASALIVEPSARLLFGGRRVKAFMDLLADPERVRQLFELLEKRDTRSDRDVTSSLLAPQRAEQQGVSQDAAHGS